MMTPLDELKKEASLLSEPKIEILTQMAKSLQRNIEAIANVESDIVSQSFLESFSGRLQVYHAFNEQKLTKKTFEYFFKSACNDSGREARLESNAVFAGTDVTVDGTAFSLKTEGAKSMRRSSITISKLMEARWIRECLTEEDFARMVGLNVVGHLDGYDRILILRAFEGQSNFEYQLLEIPLEVLKAVGELAPGDYSARTRSGGSSAQVFIDGVKAFSLRLDGSVEKITISQLKTSLCVEHAVWRVGKNCERLN